MRKILALALGLELFAGVVHGELLFKALSATATSQTFILSRESTAVMLCNIGANEVYYRLFDSFDTPAAATTAYPTIAAGAATAPVCVSITKAPTSPGLWRAVSVVCDTAETATVHVYYQ